MGITDSKSKFEHGNIVVQTDKPYFTPGEEVTGNIYISSTQNFPGSMLELRLSGKEKVEWTVKKNNGKHSTKRRYKDKSKIIDYVVPIHSFMGGYVATGQYTFPFKLKLPYDIPAS